MAQKNIRTPIVCVLGHVDHGKTSLLDKIRGSQVVASEAGAITQHIGATLIPIESIRKMSGLTETTEINIPGLLFIDTPGHRAFTTLRARGGALAEIAILVVDINEGFKQQTQEALQILRNSKTPFVIAATKVDRIPGWRVHENEPFQKTFARQNERVQGILETRLYELVGMLSDLGFNSERYDRVRDFARNIAIVPSSGITGEGVPDLLMVMIGLAQRYLTESLKITADGPGQGTILEVKEEKGLGMTLDLILYDGTLSVGDEIAVAGADGCIITKVRSLLKPRPMQEILLEDRFERVKAVTAASGIKLSAPNLDDVISGSPLRVIKGNKDEVIRFIEQEMESANITLSGLGISIKADTIGALEALSKELEAKEIEIMRADVGPVSRHDIIELETMRDPLHKVILCFNTDILPDVNEMLKHPRYSDIAVFSGNIIYRVIDEYIEWRDEEIRRREAQQFEAVVMPAKIQLLPDCTFRQSGPAVVGVRVLAGLLRPKVDLMNMQGRSVGTLKMMQDKGDTVTEAKEGMEIAVSIDGPTVGRQINVGDVLYVEIPERHVKVLEREMLSHINISSQEALSEYAMIRRKENPFWGK
ncbi:MAG: translation initiation factor IF-2 [Methanocalculus sp. MSAO_Arc1]|uniref:translation initiation factor IF-2 n=1 Tax=Methanocalculus TaxID=71151 RepID=UPI000FF565F8|nr:MULTISPECIES: translation initiation factor IF-2 [unclassified Methanocalculus]MCP1662604.1 translation initiation factor 5B [Methanocalculus sp. AMF5]RQD78941.1 MAG: translation initiation factor IF-2 [Methanocalculus sp. MSAO_Arc1]